MTNIKLHDYARIPSDAYFTIEAPRAVQVLNATMSVSGKVLEPAAGAGHLSDQLAALPAVTSVVSSDIDPAGPGVARRDMLDLKPDAAIDWVITNLPFAHQDEMIAHLLDLHPQAHHAYLVRAAYLFPAKRKAIIHTNPRFAGVVSFTKRLRWIENSKGSPAVDYVWLCFAPEGAESGVPFIKFEGGNR